MRQAGRTRRAGQHRGPWCCRVPPRAVSSRPRGFPFWGYLARGGRPEGEVQKGKPRRGGRRRVRSPESCATDKGARGREGTGGGSRALPFVLSPGRAARSALSSSGCSWRAPAGARLRRQRRPRAAAARPRSRPRPRRPAQPRRATTRAESARASAPAARAKARAPARASGRARPGKRRRPGTTHGSTQPRHASRHAPAPPRSARRPTARHAARHAAEPGRRRPRPPQRRENGARGPRRRNARPPRADSS